MYLVVIMLLRFVFVGKAEFFTNLIILWEKLNFLLNGLYFGYHYTKWIYFILCLSLRIFFNYILFGNFSHDALCFCCQRCHNFFAPLLKVNIYLVFFFQLDHLLCLYLWIQMYGCVFLRYWGIYFTPFQCFLFGFYIYYLITFWCSNSESSIMYVLLYLLM